jgi:gluconolactonase
MFDSPPRVTAEIAFRLPAHLSQAGEPAPWLRLHRHGAPLGSFLEGPSFDADGNLFVVDIPFGRVFRITPAGHFDTVAAYDGQPNGLKFGPDGAAWITDFLRGLMRLDLRTGRVETVLDAREHRFNGLNDLFFHGDDCWFTDQGMSGLQAPFGRVMRWRIGQPAPQVFLDGIPSPNGIVVDQAGRNLLVAVTRGNAVWRAPILLDGGTAKVGIFIQMSGGSGPDGLALDQAGNLAVAHPGLGAAWLFSDRGEPLLRIDSPVTSVITNCAFGGPDGRDLYLTEADSGVVLKARLPHPGLPLPAAAGDRALAQPLAP